MSARIFFIDNEASMVNIPVNIVTLARDVVPEIAMNVDNDSNIHDKNVDMWTIIIGSLHIFSSDMLFDKKRMTLVI